MDWAYNDEHDVETHLFDRKEDAQKKFNSMRGHEKKNSWIASASEDELVIDADDTNSFSAYINGWEQDTHTYLTLREVDPPQSKYVVCMKDDYVRDAQYFDTKGIPREALESLDLNDAENEGLWRDMKPMPFVAIVKATSKEDACKIAGKQKGYDSRCLFAIKV